MKKNLIIFKLQIYEKNEYPDKYLNRIRKKREGKS